MTPERTTAPTALTFPVHEDEAVKRCARCPALIGDVGDDLTLCFDCIVSTLRPLNLP